MTSAGGISKQEFQGLLSDIVAQHQQMAASIDALAARVEDMSVEQVEEVAVRVTSEVGHVRGLEEITGAFDKSEVALILACEIRKYHENGRKTGGERYYLLQATSKEIWHKQKNTDGGSSKL